MDDRGTVAHRQLARMRAMTALYHRRFFADVWLTLAVYLVVLGAAEYGADLMFGPLAFVALFGAVLTAFDASYLTMARHYAARLESLLNRELGEEVLVGARLEDAYLFPLNKWKVVSIRPGRDFSWFGFVTLFFTAIGVAGFGLGVVLAMQAIETDAARITYLAILTPLTLGALVAGLWWFPGGAGESRLTGVLDEHFGSSTRSEA